MSKELTAKPLQTRAKLSIPELQGDFRGPFEVRGVGGYFPGLQFAPTLVPFPRMIVPFEYGTPHFVETISQALRYETPLICYLRFDDQGEVLPEAQRDFGCVAYALQYEFTTEKRLRIVLEFGAPIRVCSEEIDGNLLYAGVDPLVQEYAGQEEADLARLNALCAQAVSFFEASAAAEKVAVVKCMAASSSAHKLIHGAYSIAGLLDLPYMVKLTILSCADISKRIALVGDALDSLG